MYSAERPPGCVCRHDGECNCLGEVCVDGRWITCRFQITVRGSDGHVCPTHGEMSIDAEFGDQITAKLRRGSATCDVLLNRLDSEVIAGVRFYRFYSDDAPLL